MKGVIAKFVVPATFLAGYLLQAQGTDNAGIPNTARPAQNVTLAAHNPADLTVMVNKSTVVEHGTTIRRVSVANGDIAEAIAVSSTEVLVNGKAPGDTSLIVWDTKGDRTAFEVHVVSNDSNIDAVRRELKQEVGQDVSLAVEDGSVFLRGTVKDITGADRAATIASTLGKVVNLLRVQVPAAEPQILLKVRFANIDRAVTSQLGLNLFSTGALKSIGSVGTGQFGAPPTFNLSQTPVQTSVTDLVNIFFYRPDLNFGAMLQALEAKQLLQILAEPNLLTVSGRPASFLAGGEFPFPTLQGGAAGLGQITIQFKEFGVRLNFLPTVTPRGTIHLLVTPEVSSLDYANGLTVSGFTIPGLDTRRVQTEIELENKQSFVIAGLLDNQVTESLNKIPGLGNIPLLGKLFQSRSLSKNNTELLIMVTPELVGPIPLGTKAPEVKMDTPFLTGTAAAPPQNPGPAVTGPLPPPVKRDSLPVEQLKSLNQAANQAGAQLGVQPVFSIQPPATSTPTSGAPPSSTGSNH